MREPHPISILERVACGVSPICAYAPIRRHRKFRVTSTSFSTANKVISALFLIFVTLLLIDSIELAIANWNSYPAGESQSLYRLKLSAAYLFTAYIGVIIGIIGYSTDEFAARIGCLFFVLLNVMVVGVLNSELMTICARIISTVFG
ncbi:hypothetical protein LJR009_006167 [Bosea sp. LjRoot9]|uniref:hypothetical protein n=1 Tax=Bosea sp. LjRoot9 TaxID=3342341 RepID=UPI003ECFBA64